MKEIAFAIIFLTLISSVSAIDHPSIKILSHDGDLVQTAGTAKTYQVNVTNDGDAIIDKVYLDLYFLPSTWYEIENGTLMKPNDTFTFNYTIHPPADAHGILYFNLSAIAYRGFGIVDTKTVPITISIRASGETATQTTTANVCTIGTLAKGCKIVNQTTCEVECETTSQTASPQTIISITPADLLQNMTFLVIILVLIVVLALFILLRKI